MPVNIGGPSPYAMQMNQGAYGAAAQDRQSALSLLSTSLGVDLQAGLADKGKFQRLMDRIVEMKRTHDAEQLEQAKFKEQRRATRIDSIRGIASTAMGGMNTGMQAAQLPGQMAQTAAQTDLATAQAGALGGGGGPSLGDTIGPGKSTAPTGMVQPKPGQLTSPNVNPVVGGGGGKSMQPPWRQILDELQKKPQYGNLRLR